MTRIIRHTHEPFKAFGSSIIPKAARRECSTHEIPSDRMDARKFIRESCSREPGVYGMLDCNDRLVYVGKSKLLRNRLLSYFGKNPPDQKMVRIIRQAKRIVWEPISHELLALIREQELITRWTPTFNRQGQPLQRKPVFICISNGKAPHVFSTSRISKRVRAWFGPIRGSGQAREAAAALNYVFGLRDCPDRTPFRFDEQLQLFQDDKSALCLRHELKTCVAPCAGICSRGEYTQALENAKSFLAGTDVGILDQLNSKMNIASQKQIFERAAILRDQIDGLSWLNRRLTDLRQARRDLHAVFPVPGFGKHPVWLLLNNSFLFDAVVAPFSSATWTKYRKRVETASKRSDTVSQDTHAILLQLIVNSWFRNHKSDKKQLLSYTDALSLEESLLREVA